MDDLAIRTNRIYTSGYDMVGIPREHFLPGVERVRMNQEPGSDWRPNFIHQDWLDRFPFESRIHPSDEISQERDEAWDFDIDISGLRDKANTWPDFDNTEHMADLWAELDQVLDGKRRPARMWSM